MKKLIILSLFLILALFLITSCSKQPSGQLVWPFNKVATASSGSGEVQPIYPPRRCAVPSCNPNNNQQYCANGYWRNCLINQSCNSGMCVNTSTGGGGGGGGNGSSITVTYQGVLNMLNNCYINSELKIKSDIVTGNKFCGASKCVLTSLSEVQNPENANFGLTNTITTTCRDGYNGHTNAYYIQSVCCDAPPN